MSIDKKILIADDDESILDALSLLLEDSGYKVQIVKDGNLLYNFLDPLPDLLLLDIWMAGTDGRDICKELKSNEKTRTMPVIIVSANKDIHSITSECGADDYLAKPFQVKDLFEMIQKFTG